MDIYLPTFCSKKKTSEVASVASYLIDKTSFIILNFGFLKLE